MFFILIITAIFIGVSIFFSIRSEKLQRLLITQQRENSQTRKESKAMQDSMAVIASRYEEFIKARLLTMKAQAEQYDDKDLIKHLDLISPLINNYSIIFRDCLKGKGRLKKISQKCFDSHDPYAFKQFIAWMVTSDTSLKRFWSSDNLNGYLHLVNLLLTNADKALITAKGAAITK
ncbi:hypothetical protein KO495_09665 [Colwellia sp. D2M02]|uniref:DUF4760 domain-containing protein n=1 Tax=Colwellia asteriadis TaxID=517723 RepID=A0ABN1L349_9GAMM|nr:hypothetical protein [Colwellia sp. D2M02]MBU2893585.1 hypothetical protein [Colwellia sp. D2M02]